MKRTHRGRPTTAGTPGKKSTLGIRVTAELKDRLDSAAKANDRPLSQEAELRLDRSFERQSLLGEVLELAYGRPLAGLLLLIGEGLRVGKHAASMMPGGFDNVDQWAEKPWAYDQAIRTVQLLLEAARPPGVPEPHVATGMRLAGYEQEAERLEQKVNNLHREAAARIVRAVSLGEPLDASGDANERAGLIRKSLGPMATRLSVPKGEQGHEG